MLPDNLSNSYQVNNWVDTEFLYQNSPCGYLSFYPDGTIIKINQTLLSWLQQGNDDIVENRKFHDLLSKGGRFYYEMVVLPLLNMQGFVNEINFEIKTKDDSFPSLFNALTIKNDEGEIIAINAIILNITDRKKYESLLLTAKQNAEEEKKRFEFLSNSIPNIIWTALPNGELNFVNDRFFQHFGSDASLFSLQLFTPVLHPWHRKCAMEAWKKSVENGTNYDLEVKFKTARGKYEWYVVNAVPYRDKNGEITSWFGSCTNIHERKENDRKKEQKLNNNLSEASKRLDKNSQTLREIAFNQSHLIRQPLTNILGIVQILKTMEMNENLSQLVEMLQQSAQNLDEIIKKIVYKTHSTE